MYLKNKKYLWGLFPIFLVGIVIAYFLFSQRKVIISTSSDSQFFFQFNLPETLYAGSKLSIKLPQNTPNCQLLLNSSWGTWWLDLSKNEFNIPDSVMMQSGLLDISLFYDKNLIDTPGVTLLKREEGHDSAFWIYSMLVENRDGFYKWMNECGISVSQVHERNDKHTCVHEFRTSLPSLDKTIGKIVSIPVGWWVTKEDREYIVECIKKGW
jgi:hypothetical protein